MALSFGDDHMLAVNSQGTRVRIGNADAVLAKLGTRGAITVCQSKQNVDVSSADP